MLIPFFIGLEEAEAANWYNSSWLKARQVNVTHADISADLTNYPVYINLTAVNIGTDAQADCDDFVFVDYYNVTQLDHEIETCDSVNDWAEFWVEVPTAFTANDTAIFMYYDNAAASNQQHTQETWNSNYKAVWHLNGTFNDSTVNVAHCTNNGTSAINDWYIGDARSWDGINDSIDCQSPAAIDDIWTGGGSISVWLNATNEGEGAQGQIMRKRVAAVDGWQFLLGDNSTNENLQFVMESSSDGVWYAPQVIPDSKQQLVTMTYNSDSVNNKPLFYVNGTLVVRHDTGQPTTITSDAANDLCIGQTLLAGGTVCGDTLTFDGTMDEMRLDTTIETPSWIKADWECQRGAVDGNSCILLGAQGTEPAGATFTVADDIAIQEDPALTYTINFTFTKSDDIALEDLGASALLSGTFTVSDDIAIEDFGGTTTFTVSDDIALEDLGASPSTPAVIVIHRNAIAIYLNSPNATRLGGVFSGLCDIANNFTMYGIFTNGSIACWKLP